MSAYPAYPAYQQPTAKWLDPVPSGWTTLAIGRLFRRLKRTGFPNAELLSVYRDHGVIPKSSRDDNFNKPSEDLNPYQLVRRGDLVMNKMKSWQGSIAMSEYEGIVSPAYFVYEPRQLATQKFSPKYLHHLVRSPLYITQYLSRSKGIRVNQWDLDPEAFERIEALLPPLSEQTQIACFLDYETTRIDALIEKQQQLITLLKEKRQAVISHAVTKGLNRDAPLRDSRVEWLGMVPAHWEMCRVKQATSFITSGPRGWSDLITDEGTDIFLQSGDLNDTLGLRLKTAKRIFSPQGAEGVRTRMRPGDVVVCITGANTGRVAVADELPASVYVNQHLSLVRPNPASVVPRFLATALSSGALEAYFAVAQYGLKGGLSLTNVAEAPIALPPLDEQRSIVDAIAAREKLMDAVETAATAQIELLQERRTALISAAVTGKIDVRRWQPPQSKQEDAVA